MSAKIITENGINYVETFYQDTNNQYVREGRRPVGTAVIPPPPVDFQDNFNATSYALVDGAISPNGLWKCLYRGGGVAAIHYRGLGDNYMYLAPKAATAPGETYAVALATTQLFKDFDLSLDVKTGAQLRRGSPPNNWEVAWIDWPRNDTPSLEESRFHAYGFLLKMQGYQLEKKDNENQDDAAEIYLVTNNSPSVKLNQWQKWRIIVTGTDTGTPRIQVFIDGAKIIDYVDNKTPLNSEKMKRAGPVVLYTEDAIVGFDNVVIKKL